jgi:hypothetical protein
MIGIDSTTRFIQAGISFLNDWLPGLKKAKREGHYDNLSNRCFSLFVDPYLSFTVEELHMPLDVTAQTEIKRDSKAVAAYAFEPTNEPIWIGGISQANLLTQQHISVGTQVQRRAKFMGRIIDYILEVRTLEPDHRFH